MADQQTTSGQGGGAGGAPPASGESQPVQLYRFKVKTADGREVTSAIAVVDPNAGDEHDAAGEKEDLEKKHQEELKRHEEEIAKLHEDEKQRHAADISQSHGSEAERHEQHLDDVQQHEIAKHEQQLDQAHREELDQHEGQLDEKHDKSVATLVSDAADKASQLIKDHAAELDALHLGGLRKFAEEHLVQLHDALGKAHGEQDQKHQEETAKLHDELLGKHGEELTKDCFGDSVVWVPWRRPGFQLGLDIAAIKEANPQAIGCVLGGHGITAWGDTSEACEAKMLSSSSCDFWKRPFTRSLPT